MAATADKYSKNILKAGSTTESEQILSLLPLKLAEYGSVTQAKSLFYLDDIKELQDAEGKGVFLGLVRNGSSNYSMHNAARLGKGRISDTTRDLIICNDGGLNVKGDLYINTQQTNWINHLYGPFRFISSRYNNTTEFGYEYYKNNRFHRVPLGTVIAQNKEKVIDEINLSVAQPADNTAVLVRFYITNEEGTTYKLTGFHVEGYVNKYTIKSLNNFDQDPAYAKDVEYWMSTPDFNKLVDIPKWPETADTTGLTIRAYDGYFFGGTYPEPSNPIPPGFYCFYGYGAPLSSRVFRVEKDGIFRYYKDAYEVPAFPDKVEIFTTQEGYTISVYIYINNHTVQSIPCTVHLVGTVFFGNDTLEYLDPKSGITLTIPAGAYMSERAVFIQPGGYGWESGYTNVQIRIGGVIESGSHDLIRQGIDPVYLPYYE